MSLPIALWPFRADRYQPEALQAKIGTLSLEGQALLEKDTAKKEAKANAKAVLEAKKKEVFDLPTPYVSIPSKLFAGVHGYDKTDTT